MATEMPIASSTDTDPLQAKVENFGAWLFLRREQDFDVRRLEIAVRHVHTVRMQQCIGQLPKNFDLMFPRKANTGSKTFR